MKNQFALLAITCLIISSPASAVVPTFVNATSQVNTGHHYQISANIIGTTSGAVNSHDSTNNNSMYTVPIFQFMSTGQSAVQLQLSTGTNYLLVPYAGNYNIAYSIQVLNNNGGSCEWNNFNVTLTATLPNGTTQNLDSQTHFEDGGGSHNCGNSAVNYNYWNTVSASGIPAGTLISISGQVINSGTGSDNNEAILGGTLGMTLMP